MPFDWREYLNIAKVHVNYDPNVHPCAEAKNRSAMSRAYYAALKTTYEYVTTTWQSADVGMAGGIHDGLPRWLKRLQPVDFEMREIAEKLVRLRRKRDKTDYNRADFPRAFHEAHKSVQNSDDVMRMLANRGWSGGRV